MPMTQKTILVPGIGPVKLVKLARNRSLRLSVASGNVRVSLPRWSSFAAAADFALANQPWIEQELAKQHATLLEPGQRIGKGRYMRFEHVLDEKPQATTRITHDAVIVRLLPGEQFSDETVQARATKAAIRALKKEAEMLLPPRLSALAERFGLHYNSVSVKQLKRRWGSCSSNRDIALNLFLVELPDPYIDYVLLHELAHTEQMNHGSNFWDLLVSMLPNARALSKQLRRHQPAVGNWNPGA